MVDDNSGASWQGSPGVEENPGDYIIPKRKRPWWTPDFLPGVAKRSDGYVASYVTKFAAELPRPATQSEVNALYELAERDLRSLWVTLYGIFAAGTALAVRRRGRPPGPKLAWFTTHPFMRTDPGKSLLFTAQIFGWSAICYIPAWSILTTYRAMDLTTSLEQDPRLKDVKDALIDKIERSTGRRIATPPEDFYAQNAGKAAARIRQICSFASKEEMLALRSRLQAMLETEVQQLQAGTGKFRNMTLPARQKFEAEMMEANETIFRIIDDALAAKENPALAERQQADYTALGGSDASMPAPSTTNTLGLPRTTPGQSRPVPEPTPRKWDSSDPFDRDEDDASPVARSTGKTEAADTTSAWDRVRQHAKEQGQRQGQTQSSINNDGWGSSPEQQRDVDAKRLAQQEFDEMVDRSRRQ